VGIFEAVVGEHFLSRQEPTLFPKRLYGKGTHIVRSVVLALPMHGIHILSWLKS
jgi:hypothetical protein